MFYYGKQYGYKVIAMDLLGPSLEDQHMRRTFFAEYCSAASRPNAVKDKRHARIYIYCNNIYFYLRYVLFEYYYGIYCNLT